MQARYFLLTANTVPLYFVTLQSNQLRAKGENMTEVMAAQKTYITTSTAH